MRRPRTDPLPPLAGGYAGALAATVATTVYTASAWLPALSAAVVAALLVAALASTRRRLATELAHWPASLFLILPVAVPAGWLLAGGGAGGTNPAWLVPAATGVLLGVGVYVVTNRRVLARAKAHGEPLVEWQAEPPAGHRRRSRALAALGGIALLLSAVVLDGSLAPTLTAAAGAFLLVLVPSLGRPRRYVVLPGGLWLAGADASAGQFVPWSRFRGYAISDGALVLDRRGPLPSPRADLAAVADPAAVTETLDAVLVDRDRRDGPGHSRADG